MDLVEYLDEKGRSPFEIWFNKINAQAAAKVTTALVRLEGGNTSNVKSLGSGVHELKIDFGPGYRVYFGYNGPTPDISYKSLSKNFTKKLSKRFISGRIHFSVTILCTSKFLTWD